MPIHCLPMASPSKLCRGRRASDPTTGDKSKRSTKKSLMRNFDEELLQHLQEARRHSIDGGAPRRDGGREGRAPTPSLPYSKDFGSFDLTLCLAEEDGRCVVLVEYEQRVFVNGRQIYIQGDGKVLDRLGQPSPKFQGYYNCAIEAKKLLRGKGSRNGGRSPTKSQIGDIDSGKSDDELMRESLDQTEGRRDRRRLLEKNRRVTFESELIELEAAFGQIIARLCKLILDVIGHETPDTESIESSEEAADSCHRDRLQTTLGRLSDQFQSVVELSSSLKDQHESAEAVQNMWMADGTFLMSGGDTTGRLESENNKSCVVRDAPDDPQKQWPSQFNRFITKPHTLWEENQTLRRDVRTLEIELHQLEQLHKKVEDQFFEAESDRVDAQNQLSATTAENEALKKQLARGTGAKGAKCDTDSLSESSTSSLLSRFAKRLSGSVRHTSPLKKASSSTCSSSNEAIDDLPKPETITDQEKKERDVVTGFNALDRQHNLRSEMKRLRGVYKNMEEDIERLSEENRSLRMRILKMERERGDMKVKIRDADCMAEDRNREIEQLDSVNSKLDARCTLLASEKAALAAEVTRSNALCAETSSRLRTLERELTVLENTHKETAAEKQQCRDKLDLLNQEHIEECNKTSKLLKDKASIESQLSRLRREQGELAAELDKVRVENDANEKGRRHSEKENNRLELELQAAERCQAKLTDDLHNLHRSLAKSETSFVSLERESDKMRSKCTKLDAEAGELRSRSEELYLGNRMLEEENSCLKEMNRQLQKKNAEMLDTVSSLTDTNAGIRAKMRQWNRDNISMENKMKKLVRAKAELHGVIRQLNIVHSDIENRFEKLDSEYADFEVRLNKGGKNLTTVMDDQGAALEEDIQREYEQLQKQLRDQEGQGTSGEKVGSRSKTAVQKRSSSAAVANLKNEIAELEKDILGRVGNSTGEKAGPPNENEVTFVSACSDLDSGELGMWWDDTTELNSSLMSGNEDK